MNIEQILTPPKTIAVIGLSDKPKRPSYQVANYLQQQGFKIIPINPNINTVLGEKSYPSLSNLPKDIKIDIVDIFRKSEAVLDIIQKVLQLKMKPVIWMQEGVISPQAKELAEQNDLRVVMDKCMKKEHYALNS